MFQPVAAGLGQVPIRRWAPPSARLAQPAYHAHPARRRLGQAEFAGRVVVQDLETEAFVAGADVSLLGPGETVILTKKTDEGGNAAFLAPDLQGKIPADVEARGLAYKIEASGYQTQGAPFMDREIVTVYLQPSPGFLGIPTTGWIVGGVGILALIAVLAP